MSKDGLHTWIFKMPKYAIVYSHHLGELKALWQSMRWYTISMPSPNVMMAGTVTRASVGL